MSDPGVSQIEWFVLDSLATTREDFAHIHRELQSELPEVEVAELRALLVRMCDDSIVEWRGCKGLPDSFEELPTAVLYDSEAVSGWFGLTSRGSKAWELGALEYTGEAVDWSEAYVVRADYKSSRGHVDGVSREVCLAGLETMVPYLKVPGARVTSESPIDGFWQNYHKWIDGGLRIEFEW